MNTYKNLKFWQTARETSLLLIKMMRKLPNERVVWIISDQVLRSSFSIGANITEGYGKYQGKEYLRFIHMALGSANETEYWLELLAEIYPQFLTEIDTILSKNLETIKMITATIKTLQTKRRF